MEDNDNERPGARSRWSSRDPHGQAAMLLVESLLHELIAKSVISVEDAIDVVDIAMDTKMEAAPDLDVPPEITRQSLDLLAAIAASLRIDTTKD